MWTPPLVDFLYRGEANILQEDVDAFLSIVKDPRVKGLMEPTEKVENKSLHPEKSTNKPNASRIKQSLT